MPWFACGSGAENAVRCIGLRSALRWPSQRTACVIAARCVFPACMVTVCVGRYFPLENRRSSGSLFVKTCRMKFAGTDSPFSFVTLHDGSPCATKLIQKMSSCG